MSLVKLEVSINIMGKIYGDAVGDVKSYIKMGFLIFFGQKKARTIDDPGLNLIRRIL